MKLQEIKEKSIDELKELILEQKKELFTLRMSHNKIKQLENTASIKNTKKRKTKGLTLISPKFSDQRPLQSITSDKIFPTTRPYDNFHQHVKF